MASNTDSPAPGSLAMKMGEAIRDPPVPILLPDNSYEKAVRKGEIKVKKVNADNYIDWADSMQLWLDAKELWRLIDGSEPMPDRNSRPKDYKEWCLDDKQARMWIHANCEDPQHPHTKKCTTAKAAWEALQQVHGKFTQGRLVHLMTRFFTYKAGASESIEEIKMELCKIQDMIINVRPEETPSDLMTAWALMRAIDNEAYDLAKFHLEEMKDLSLAYTVERLKAVEMKLKDANTSTTESAYKEARNGLAITAGRTVTLNTIAPIGWRIPRTADAMRRNTRSKRPMRQKDQTIRRDEGHSHQHESLQRRAGAELGRRRNPPNQVRTRVVKEKRGGWP